MINKRVRTREKRLTDSEKLDKGDRFMLKYMGWDWFQRQKRIAETIFTEWPEAENRSDKSCP